MNHVILILISVSIRVSDAVLAGSEADVDPAYNETGNMWSCFEPMYQVETVEEMSESVISCTKRSLYLGLVNNMDSNCIDIGDGVTFSSEAETMITPRELFPTGEEPATFRGVIDAYSTFLSRRAARWDLGFLYPGLVMRIGPTMNGAGILEFALEKRLDYSDRSKLRPGQLIVRRTILPHLLGFRMNLMSLLPVVFAIMLFMTKNAFVFSKVALLISTVFALKSLFLMQQMRPTQSETYDVVETGSQSGSIGISQSGSSPFGGSTRPRPYAISTYPDNLLLQMFSATAPPFRGVNDKFHGPADKDIRVRGSRNFAWERRE